MSPSSDEDYVRAVKAIARRIEQARHARGWSQQQLADELGLSQATVHKWVAGKGLPSYANLRRLGQVLQVGAQWLMSPLLGEEDSQPLAAAARLEVMEIRRHAQRLEQLLGHTEILLERDGDEQSDVTAARAR